jgi:hypothetical protein
MWQLWLLMSMPIEEGMFSTSHRDTPSNFACFSPVAVRSGCIYPVRSSPGKNVQKLIIHLVVVVPEWFNKGLKDLQPETRRTAVFLLPLSVYLEASYACYQRSSTGCSAPILPRARHHHHHYQSANCIKARTTLSKGKSRT